MRIYATVLGVAAAVLLLVAVGLELRSGPREDPARAAARRRMEDLYRLSKGDPDRLTPGQRAEVQRLRGGGELRPAPAGAAAQPSPYPPSGPVKARMDAIWRRTRGDLQLVTEGDRRFLKKHGIKIPSAQADAGQRRRRSSGAPATIGARLAEKGSGR